MKINYNLFLLFFSLSVKCFVFMVLLLQYKLYLINLFLFTHTHIEKKPPLKSFDDVQALISQGKKRELKLLLRENAWPINSTIRAQLWPAICSQHQVGKSMLEGYYWDMVNQVKAKTFINSCNILRTKSAENKQRQSLWDTINLVSWENTCWRCFHGKKKKKLYFHGTQFFFGFHSIYFNWERQVDERKS